MIVCEYSIEYLHVPSMKHQLHCHRVVYIDTTETPKPQNIAKIKPKKKRQKKTRKQYQKNKHQHILMRKMCCIKNQKPTTQRKSWVTISHL